LAIKYSDRLQYFDACLMKGYTRTINPLECRDTDPDLIELQAQNLVRAFESLVPDAKLSAYMRTLLKPCLFVLLSNSDSNLYDLKQLLL